MVPFLSVTFVRIATIGLGLAEVDGCGSSDHEVDMELKASGSFHKKHRQLKLISPITL
jgi:hypothetical protein